MTSVLGVALMALYLHGHHVSVSEVVVQKEERKIQYTLQVFANEAEEQIRQKNGLLYFDIREKEAADEVQEFLEPLLELETAAGPLKGEWVGHKIEGNYLKVFVEYSYSDSPQITICNRVFLGVLPTQENILHVQIGDQRVTRVCTERDPCTDLVL